MSDKCSEIKPLNEIDNLEDLIKYEEWIKSRGCPAGEPGPKGTE